MGTWIVIIIYVMAGSAMQLIYNKRVDSLEEEIARVHLSLEESLNNYGEMIDIARYYKKGMEDTHKQNVKLLKAMNKRGGR